MVSWPVLPRERSCSVKSKFNVTVLVLGFLLAIFMLTDSPTIAQVRTGLFRGAGHGGAVNEGRFRFRTLKGNYGTISTDRNLLLVPKNYGEPFGVTGFGNKSVIWYKDDKGVLRNVVIEDGSALVQTAMTEHTPK